MNHIIYDVDPKNKKMEIFKLSFSQIKLPATTKGFILQL